MRKIGCNFSKYFICLPVIFAVSLVFSLVSCESEMDEKAKYINYVSSINYDPSNVSKETVETSAILLEDEIHRSIYRSLISDKDLDGDGTKNSEDADIDGDGLTNEEEAILGTNPYLADTDGDGFSDKEEVNLGFNPTKADLPNIKLTLKSTPSIIYTTEKTSTHTEGETITITSGKTRTTTTNETNSHSAGWSNQTSYKFGLKAGIKWAKNAANEMGLSEISAEISSEIGHSWGSSINDTNSISHAESNAMATTHADAVNKQKTDGYSIKGGVLSYVVELKNESNIAYVISNPMLTAYYTTWDNEGLKTFKNPVGNLVLGTNASITLSPNESREYVFSCNMSTSLAETVIKNANSIIVELSSYGITYEGKDITGRLTTANARCAGLSIDYGPYVTDIKSADYKIATKIRKNPSFSSYEDFYDKVSLRQLLENAGFIETAGGTKKEGSIIIDDNGHILSINGIENGESKDESGSNGTWFIQIMKNNSLTGKYTLTCYEYNEISVDDLIIGSNDEVLLMYSVDLDGDGVPARVEKQFGMDDTKADTDDDGLNDFDELYVKYTNPLDPDTDHDVGNDYNAAGKTVAEKYGNWTDSKDPYPKVSRFLDDAHITEINIYAGDSTTVTKTLTPSSFNTSLVLTEAYEIQAQSLRLKVKTVNNQATFSVTHEETKTTFNNQKPENEIVVSNLKVGKNTIIIDIDSSGNSQKYTINITGKLQQPVIKSVDKLSERQAFSVNIDPITDTRITELIIVGMKEADYKDIVEGKELIKPDGSKEKKSTIDEKLQNYVNNPGGYENNGSSECKIFKRYKRVDDTAGKTSLFDTSLKLELSEFGKDYYCILICRDDAKSEKGILNNNYSYAQKVGETKDFKVNLPKREYVKIKMGIVGTTVYSYYNKDYSPKLMIDCYSTFGSSTEYIIKEYHEDKWKRETPSGKPRTVEVGQSWIASSNSVGTIYPDKKENNVKWQTNEVRRKKSDFVNSSTNKTANGKKMKVTYVDYWAGLDNLNGGQVSYFIRYDSTKDSFIAYRESDPANSYNSDGYTNAQDVPLKYGLNWFSEDINGDLKVRTKTLWCVNIEECD